MENSTELLDEFWKATVLGNAGKGRANGGWGLAWNPRNPTFPSALCSIFPADMRSDPGTETQACDASVGDVGVMIWWAIRKKEKTRGQA